MDHLLPPHRQPGTRTTLTGLSLLVLVALSLGASVSKSDAAVIRGTASAERVAMVTTCVRSLAQRPVRKQDERPSAARPAIRPASDLGVHGDGTPAHAPSNLPCLREALLALPPPRA